MVLSVLVVAAHPDDMEFFAGGTAAKLADQGAEVSEVIVTNGERGTLVLGGEDLIARRRDEAIKAAKILGLRDVIFLDYPDGMLKDFRFNEIRQKLMGEIRRLRPNVLITWDPFAPYENHQDHRIAGMAATEAASFANLPLYHPEQVSTPEDLHIVAQTFYFAKHHVKADHVEDISKQIDRKIEALLAHRTQMEFLVASVRQNLIAQGKPESIWGKADPTNYRDLIDTGIRKRAASVGKRIGASFGEEFRLEGADGLSRMVEEL